MTDAPKLRRFMRINAVTEATSLPVSTVYAKMDSSFSDAVGCRDLRSCRSALNLLVIATVLDCESEAAVPGSLPA
jgi:hypothetical protein